MQENSTEFGPNDSSIYYRFKSVILFCARCMGILPKSILKFLFYALEPFPGTIAVFLRFIVAKNLFANMGDNVYIANHVEFRHMQNLSVGSNVSFQRNCYVDALGGVTIGSDVSIAHQSSIVSFDHGFDDLSKPIRKNPYLPDAIEISNDVWIGAGVRVLAGARIANRCIVAAGAVVTKKTACEPGSLVAGVPAVIKAKISQ